MYYSYHIIVTLPEVTVVIENMLQTGYPESKSLKTYVYKQGGFQRNTQIYLTFDCRSCDMDQPLQVKHLSKQRR